MPRALLLVFLASPFLVSATIRGRTRRSDIASLEARILALETHGSCAPEVRIHVDVEGGSFEAPLGHHEDHGEDVDHSHEQHGHTHDTHADHGEHHDASHEDTSAETSDEHAGHHAHDAGHVAHAGHEHDESAEQGSGVDVHLHLHLDRPAAGYAAHGEHGGHAAGGDRDTHAYASCKIVGASGHDDLAGHIHFRQDWMDGNSDVEVGFEVTGGSASTGYELHVQQFGDTSDQCQHIGDMFMPNRGGGHEHHHQRVKRAHHGGHGGRGNALPGGRRGGHGRREHMERVQALSCDLGDIATDSSGALTGRQLHDEITLIGPGKYLLYGRSIAIREEGAGSVVGCCSVARSAGTYWQE